MRPVVVIQSTVGRWGFRLAAALAIGLLVAELVLGGPVAALRALPWLALVVMICWLLWSAASIELGADRLRLDNPLTRTDIGWDAVTGVRNSWGISVDAQGRSYRAWAAPARSGASMAQGRAAGVRDLQTARPDAAPLYFDLDARAAELLIGEEARIRHGRPDCGQCVQHVVRWPRIAVLAVLAIAAGLTLL
ncbi:hypothetical protein ACTQ49_03730 [Luteococcus sp. Sow4_B9]|uniref:hypothetical protein n=1 Tax=Luteococcus sp. Sow4_B9 TaxID=3438792 RepID=UPI003F998678